MKLLDSQKTETSKRKDGVVLALLTLTLVMVISTTVVLNIALPTVVGHFQASPASSTWLLLAPNLINACLLVPFGRIADSYGRRRMFLIGLAIFIASATAAGFAPSIEVLILIVVVQAVGAAILMSNTGALVASVFKGEKLNSAMGIYMVGVSVAQMLGPSIGGLIVAHLSWSWLYWAQTPLAMLCLVLGLIYLRNLPDRTPRPGNLDYGGSIVLLLSLGLLLTGISAVQNAGLISWQFFVPTVGAMALVPLLYWIETNAKDPILQFSLLRRRAFIMANLSNLLNAMPRFTTVVLLSLYFQVVRGCTPLQTALLIIPLPVGVTVSSLLADKVAAAVGARKGSAAAAGVMFVGVLILMFSVLEGWQYTVIAAGLTLLGLGAGVFTPLNSVVIISQAPDSEVGTVNALRLTILNLGTSLATATSLSIVAATLPISGRDGFFHATAGENYLPLLQKGYFIVFLVMAVATVISAIAAYLSTDGRRASMSATSS
ncbi:MFS transporter [Nocardia farcinica]|uniref:MFS transporter n=1 Tax=Nocardia farcinica TaxID=37329 RepID=UPI00189634C6|nr:MFS transporter [Nocardia farcinica]MBF6258372.1 MFS transporter [Nocardia farcinica]